jgi:hypothetical protein
MMDNLQIWIYVILGIVYLIGKARKKPEQPPVQQRRQRGGEFTEQVGPKPLTFEDLLREITEAKEVETKPVLRPAQELQDYDDELVEETEPERPDYDFRKQETYKTFEQSKYEAFNRLSYEETMKLEDTDMKFGKFQAFEEEKGPSMAAKVAMDFADMDKVKRAFIMSEIFNRKYA